MGIALGGEGVGVLRQAAEGDLLLRHVRLRGEGPGHRSVSQKTVIPAKPGTFRSEKAPRFARGDSIAQSEPNL